MRLTGNSSSRLRIRVLAFCLAIGASFHSPCCGDDQVPKEGIVFEAKMPEKREYIYGERVYARVTVWHTNEEPMTLPYLSVYPGPLLITDQRENEEPVRAEPWASGMPFYVDLKKGEKHQRDVDLVTYFPQFKPGRHKITFGLRFSDHDEPIGTKTFEIEVVPQNLIERITIKAANRFSSNPAEIVPGEHYLFIHDEGARWALYYVRYLVTCGNAPGYIDLEFLGHTCTGSNPQVLVDSAWSVYILGEYPKGQYTLYTRTIDGDWTKHGDLTVTSGDSKPGMSLLDGKLILNCIGGGTKEPFDPRWPSATEVGKGASDLGHAGKDGPPKSAAERQTTESRSNSIASTRMLLPIAILAAVGLTLLLIALLRRRAGDRAGASGEGRVTP